RGDQREDGAEDDPDQEPVAEQPPARLEGRVLEHPGSARRRGAGKAGAKRSVGGRADLVQRRLKLGAKRPRFAPTDDRLTDPDGQRGGAAWHAQGGTPPDRPLPVDASRERDGDPVAALGEARES